MRIIIWILTLPLLIFFLRLLPFPDIPQQGLDFIGTIFAQIWYFDKYVPVGLFMGYLWSIIVIETSIMLMRLIDDIRSALTGAKPLFGIFTDRQRLVQDNPDKPGEGSIGGA